MGGKGVQGYGSVSGIKGTFPFLRKKVNVPINSSHAQDIKVGKGCAHTALQKQYQGGGGSNRKGDGESTALIGFAVDINTASMGLCESLGQAEA